MGKRVRILCVAVFVIFTVFGCGACVWAQGIKMAASDWPVWQLVVGMNEQGSLGNFDLAYEKYAVTIDGFSKGKFDVTFMTIYDFIATQRDNPNGVIIAVQDFSNGGDGIVLRPEMSSASSLKGRAIGLPTEAVSLYLMHMYLARNKMSLDDIKLVDIPGEFVSKAYVSNRALSGIAGWNPNLSEAIAAGGKPVVTSADFPENIFDCVVVNRESLQKDRAVYVQFLKDWFKAVNDPLVTQAAARKLNVTVTDLQSWLGDANIYRDAGGSLAMFGRLKTVASEIQSFYSVKPVSITGGASGIFGIKPLDIDSLFDDSLLKEIVPAPAGLITVPVTQGAGKLPQGNESTQ
ncbi:MAG: hypothetical protein HQL20_05250 [Candidatus Omnitrophica bacterium]|nr:hypothetical protein [Candidatus Omnitrophota bacterium]